MQVLVTRLLLVIVLAAGSTFAVAQQRPNPPSGLTAAAMSTTRIDLAWNDNSTNETSFEVERAPVTNGVTGTFARIVTLGSNVHQYSDTTRVYSTTYAYRVRAVRNTQSSAYSNTASATTLKAVTLHVSGFPASSVAGAAASVTVTALDANGSLAVGYPGVVRFSANDPQAVLPANSTVPGASASFSVTFKTAGTQALAAADVADATLAGSQGGIAVVPAAAARLTMSFSTALVAGTPGSGTVIAYDAYDNVATGYRGTIGFATTTANAALPPASAFTAADAGAKAFSASLNTAGTQSLSVSDTGNGALAATQAGIVVSAGAAAQLALAYPASVVAGVPASLTVSAQDAYGNAATGYRGSVAFSTSSANAALPATYTFSAADAGSHGFTAALNTAGTQSLSMADTANAALAATLSGIAVSAGNASRLALAYPGSVVAGAPASLTVTAQDGYGNLAAGYRGTVAFSSTSANATLPASYAFSPADSGTHAFTAALNTAGTQSVTATDAANGLSGVRNDIAVTASGATALVVAYPAAVVAGVASPLTVTAKDSYGNVAAGYTGTVTFTTSSTNATLPAPYTFTAADAGTRAFTASLNTAGAQSLTSTDSGNAVLTAVRSGIAVSAGSASRLAVTYPGAVVAGTSTPLSLSAQDAYGNVVAGYRGTVAFSTSSANASLPASYSFSAADAGTHGFSATLNTAGTQSLSATDAANGISGTRTDISVAASFATKFVVSYPGAVVAGVGSALTVTAQDFYGNVVTGYTGTVTFTSSSTNATLPAPYAFTAADAGTHEFTASLNTAGTQNIIARDTVASFLGSRTGIAVTGGDASVLVATVQNANLVAGTPANVTVTAKDAYGNVAPGYRGTVTLATSSALSTLPPDYAYAAADAGAHVFGVSLNSRGTQTLTARDTANASLTSTLSGLNVLPGPPAKFTFGAIGTVTAGTSFSPLVNVWDQFGNWTTAYRGTIVFTSTSTNSVLPAPYTWTAVDGAGKGFPVTLDNGGPQTLTVTDSVNSAFTGSATVTVNGAAAASMTAAYPASVVAGTPASLTVSLVDVYGNIASGYRGTVAFSSTSPNANLPVQYAFTAADGGVHIFPVALNSAGPRSVTARDTVNAAFTATVADIAVGPGDATRFTLAYPAAVTAGVARDLDVVANDAYGNLATGYRGDVGFASTSPSATLPDPYAFTADDAGTHRFAAALNNEGTRAITATDTLASAVTGTIAGIVVTGGDATRLEVQGYPALVTAGTRAGFNVRALDAYGNVSVGYAGTVSFTSSDGQALLPTPTVLAGGKGRLTTTLRTAGIQSIGAQDAQFSAVQTGINVIPAQACVGGTWKNGATGELVQAGAGLREPPVLGVYGTQRATGGGPIVTPQCPYLAGLVRVPVLMLDYADYEPLTDPRDPSYPTDAGMPGYVKGTPEALDAYVNGPAGAAQYFRDVSGGKADVQFDVFGWITSSTPGSYLQPRANYLIYRAASNDYVCDKARIFLDAMRNAVAFHGANLAAYDRDGNGVMDGAVLLHEGPLGVCGANMAWLDGSGSSATPPVFTYRDVRTLVPATDPNAALFAGQKVFAQYFNNIPESGTATTFYPTATWAHELGHLLLGYADYYDNNSQLQTWGLSGNHQDTPTHPAAFEKWLFAHWIEPVVATASGTYTLDANEISDGGVYDGGTYLVRVPIDGDPSHFLTIENRWFDAEGNTGTQWARAFSRESGLLIMEINLNVDDFSVSPKQLARQIPPRPAPYQDFRAWRAGDSFSQCYTSTCITITPNSPPGAQMQFALTVAPK